MRRAGWPFLALILMAITSCGTAAPPAGGAPAASAKARLPIRIGYQADADAPLLIARARGLFAKAGLDASFTKFEAGPPMFAALKTGGIDVAGEGTGPVVVGPVRGIPQIGFLSAYDSSANSGLVVRGGSGIRSARDLRGKAVGATRGSGAYFALVYALQRAGLSLSDVEYKNLDPASLLAAFKKGDIAAASAWSPWAQELQAMGGQLVESYKQAGLLEPEVWVANTSWAPAHVETLKRFIGALDEATLALRQNPDQATRLLADAFQISTDLAAQIEGTTVYVTAREQLAPDFDLSLTHGYDGCDAGLAKSLATVAELMRQDGQIQSVPSCRQLFTPSYLQAYAVGG